MRLRSAERDRVVRRLFDDADMLGVTEADLHARFCLECDLGPICAKERSVGKLSPVCLDGVATIVLRNPN